VNATFSGAKLAGRIAALGFDLVLMDAEFVLLAPGSAYTATSTVNHAGNASGRKIDGSVCDISKLSSAP
jgi:hypothetical protein